MLSVVIPNILEPTVVRLTYSNLQKELLNINGGAELIIADSWRAGIVESRGDYICLVEPDCLVSGGYFSSNLGLFKAHKHYRKLAMVSSCIGVADWDNRIYNYHLAMSSSGDSNGVMYWRIAPERVKKGKGLYPVQVGFVPGAIIRRSVAVRLLKKINWANPDLVALSTELSFYLWSTNRRVLINPNTTYVSDDKTLENPAEFDPKIPRVAINVFDQEQLI